MSGHWHSFVDYLHINTKISFWFGHLICSLGYFIIKMYWSEHFIKTCPPKLEMVAMPLTTIVVVVILLMGWWNRSKCENDSEQNPWMTYIIENNQNVGFFTNKRMLDPFCLSCAPTSISFFWLHDDRRFFFPITLELFEILRSYLK